MTPKRQGGGDAPTSRDSRRNRASRTKMPSRGGSQLVSIGLAYVCLWPVACAAQEAPPVSPDFFTPNVYVESVWDDNLFRLPAGEAVPAFLGSSQRSDIDVIDDVGFRIDKSYGLQRITIDADVRQNRYETYGYLNFIAKNGDATWTWALTPDVTGHILYSRAQTLNSFADFTTFGRNISTNEVSRFDLDGRLGGAIHIGAAAYQTTQDNTLPVFDFDNTRINSFEPNLSYESAAGNSVGLYGRIARGHYLEQPLDPIAQLDDAFTEHEAGIRVSYVIDGLTSLYCQIGELSRQNSHFESRNFRGAVGQISGQWAFTAKTSGVITASRSIGAYVSSTSSYVATTKISVGPQWLATEKTSIRVTADDTEYSFQGPIAPVSVLRDDHTASVTVLAKWQPLREINFTGSIVHSTRHSTFPGLGFVDNTANLMMQLTF